MKANPEELFVAGLIPKPVRILRVPLLPYSIGHELILVRERNPLLAPREHFNQLPIAEQIKAIVRAVQVCSRTWEQNKRPDRWVKFWCWLIRRSDFPLAIAEFRNYRDEGSTFPPIWEEPGDGEDKGRKLGSPHMARLLDYSLQVCGPAAFDAPLGAMQWLYLSSCEAEGLINIANEHERQIKEEIEQHQADYDREQEEKRRNAEGSDCQP